MERENSFSLFSLSFSLHFFVSTSEGASSIRMDPPSTSSAILASMQLKQGKQGNSKELDQQVVKGESNTSQLRNVI